MYYCIQICECRRSLVETEVPELLRSVPTPVTDETQIVKVENREPDARDAAMEVILDSYCDFMDPARREERIQYNRHHE